MDLRLPATEAPDLPPLTESERLGDRYAVIGLDARRQVVGLFRAALDELGAVPNGVLPDRRTGPVRLGGLVVTRQHPMTAKGTVFLALEDETGMVNVTLWPDTWARLRGVVRRHALLLVDGDLQREGIRGQRHRPRDPATPRGGGTGRRVGRSRGRPPTRSCRDAAARLTPIGDRELRRSAPPANLRQRRGAGLLVLAGRARLAVVAPSSPRRAGRGSGSTAAGTGDTTPRRRRTARRRPATSRNPDTMNSWAWAGIRRRSRRSPAGRTSPASAFTSADTSPTIRPSSQLARGARKPAMNTPPMAGGRTKYVVHEAGDRASGRWPARRRCPPRP